MTGAALIFATVFCAGFIAVVLFGERAMDGPTAINIAGICFGIALMLASILLLPGEF